VGDMRSVPEPSSVGGSPGRRDPWAGFAAGSASAGRYPSPVANGVEGAPDTPADDTVADLARRLQVRVDGQESLVDSVAELAQRADDRARVAELRDVTRRLRRDSEALLLLCGADPGVHRGAPNSVPEVLADAVAQVDEPSRVGLRRAPAATVAGMAAVELRHLVAELIDEASPGTRVEVGARLDADGALFVEIVVAGRGWSDPRGGARRGGSTGPGIAERLARRSGVGIRLRRPLVDQVEGLVATVYCPAALVTGRPDPDPWTVSIATPPAASQAQPDTASPRLSPPSPAYAHSNGDELFGPLPVSVAAVGTPIFEAVASAWFRDDERRLSGDEWDTPGDLEWRAAAARATRTDAPPTTASGLPRRSPGDRLVPPPRGSRPSAPPDERVPERVRDRLATYQRGLRQGRHRAADAPAAPAVDPSESQAWTADGW
jgi:hypothetical protein